MVPILTAPQIREVDAHTIANQPISSVDLIERASRAFTAAFVDAYPDKDKSITVYCGTGNNGGDGLAIARLLKAEHYSVNVKIARFSDKSSPDFEANLKKLKPTHIEFIELSKGDTIPTEESDIIIDALLGSGLNKPLGGDYGHLVEYLNSLNKTVVAVDVPTGLYTEGLILKDALVLKAKLVITFQQTKLNFLLPESAPYMDDFRVVNIGLDNTYITSLNSPYQLAEEADIKGMLNPRKQFSHKGTYGHALIIAGQPQTMGAALLCASACAHTGAGLTTACIPKDGLTSLNTLLPEVMAITRGSNIEWGKFNTLAIGPGLGTQTDSLRLLETTLREFKNPIVIDADALNLIAENRGLFKFIPKGSIITPHMKEFDRLFGEHKTWNERILTAQKKAFEFGINILLKNRYTIIATPGGQLYFNPTGNPAMASGGMGDVLTGVIVSLLAQGYQPHDACIIGAYLHGKTGDDLALPNKMATVLAGELAKNIPVTLAKLKA